MPSDKPHNGVISLDLIHSILVYTTLTLEFVFAEVSTNVYCVGVILSRVLLLGVDIRHVPGMLVECKSPLRGHRQL